MWAFCWKNSWLMECVRDKTTNERVAFVCAQCQQHCWIVCLTIFNFPDDSIFRLLSEQLSSANLILWASSSDLLQTHTHTRTTISGRYMHNLQTGNKQRLKNRRSAWIGNFELKIDPKLLWRRNENVCSRENELIFDSNEMLRIAHVKLIQSRMSDGNKRAQLRSSGCHEIVFDSCRCVSAFN